MLMEIIIKIIAFRDCKESKAEEEERGTRNKELGEAQKRNHKVNINSPSTLCLFPISAFNNIIIFTYFFSFSFPLASREIKLN